MATSTENASASASDERGASEYRPVPRRRGVWWQRSLILVCLTTVAVVFGGQWASYRMGHVVTSDARVRGTIARVGSRIDGRVANIAVQPNQRVRRGDILVHLEDRHLQAALKRARIAVERAEQAVVVERNLIEEDRAALGKRAAATGTNHAPERRDGQRT